MLERTEEECIMFDTNFVRIFGVEKKVQPSFNFYEYAHGEESGQVKNRKNTCTTICYHIITNLLARKHTFAMMHCCSRKKNKCTL